MYPVYSQTEMCCSRTVSRPICYTICKGKLKRWRHQTRFLKALLKATLSWSLHYCFCFIFLLLKFTWNSYNNCVTSFFLFIHNTQVFCTQSTQHTLTWKFHFVSWEWKKQLKTKAYTLINTPANLAPAENVFSHLKYWYLIDKLISVHAYNV